MKDLSNYRFPFSHRWERFCWLKKQYGLKAIYKQFRYSVARPFSRDLIEQFAPQGIGVEIGTGRQSIAPLNRTVLSDGHKAHSDHENLAREIFPADEIPYSDGSFSFVLSEHVLEHLANPIKALQEWLRVLKSRGTIFLFLPHPARTFDHRRPPTTLAHLIEDFRQNRPASDRTHLAEWREKVITPGLAPHYAHFSDEEMVAGGNIHHHVWRPQEIRELFEHLGIEILYCAEQVPDRLDSFVVIGRK